MAKSQRRHYSDEARAAALAVLDANGGNLTRAAREAGVPLSTLKHWRDDRDRAAPAELRKGKADDLATVYERIAYQATALIAGGLEAIADAKDEDGNPAAGVTALRHLSALNTVAGTATDKHQLLKGEPTERIAHDDLTPAEAIVAARRLRLLPSTKAKSA